MSRPNTHPAALLGKSDYERLSNFRYRLRHFMRISEQICQEQGLTPLQYQLLLHVRGFPGRDWASIGELAERLQCWSALPASTRTNCNACSRCSPSWETERIDRIRAVPGLSTLIPRIVGCICLPLAWPDAFRIEAACCGAQKNVDGFPPTFSQPVRCLRNDGDGGHARRGGLRARPRRRTPFAAPASVPRRRP